MTEEITEEMRTVTKKLIGKFYILEDNNPDNWSEGFTPIIIEPTLEDCIDKFKEMYNNGDFGSDVIKYAYRIRSFKIGDHINKWTTEKKNIEDFLPQKRDYKALNDPQLTKEVNKILKSRGCLAAGLFYQSLFVDCFSNRMKDRFCELHGCTFTNCNCRVLVKEIYEILFDAGYDVYYYRPIEKKRN